MFLGVLGGATARDMDPERERDPPPQPTPVSFPRPRNVEAIQWGQETPAPNLRTLFSKVSKPADITQAHLEALNFEFLPQCTAAELVPNPQDGTSYFPKPSLEPSADTPPYAGVIKANSSEARKRKAFEDRLAELKLDNDAAYRVITRTTKQGVKAPRLAYMRKLWEGLENMSQYWDCSMDHYFEAWSDTSEDGDSEKSTKRARLDSASLEEDSKDSEPASEIEKNTNGTEKEGDSNDSTATDQSDSHECSVPTEEPTIIWAFEHHDRPISISPIPQVRERYTGRRISTGRSMPDSFRSDAVKGFVEGVIWPFGASLAPPRRMPMVQINKLNLPVRQTAVVSRLPKDRRKAQLGYIEGPILGVQVRAETDFNDQVGNPLPRKALLDRMREIGGLLQIAQERRREGKKEVKPGSGQWWTEKPRWGGGPGGEVAADEDNAAIIGAVEDALATRKANARDRKRRAPALLWKEVRCGSGFWDSKTDYKAIGKSPGSDYDEVFMVSSLNHHISILKMTVHDAYLEYLEYLTLPSPLPTDEDWCRPKVDRSEWFDLFDAEQRMAAFRALWDVMAYLTRPIDVSTKEGVQDAAMSDV